MTDLLDEAIARARQLPPEEQDLAAEAIFAVIERDQPHYELSPEQVEQVRRTQRALREGTTRLATDKEVAAMWRRYGA